MLLYPVYAVLFTATGLSPAEISSLFAVWSFTAFAAELPSGAWADRYSRRWLIAAGPLVCRARMRSRKPGANRSIWVMTASVASPV